MSILRICLGASLVVATFGCGSADPATSSTTMRLTGTADRSAMKLDNAKAVAQAANGKVYSAYLDRSGHFTLDLPPNAAYRVSIANTTSKGQLRVLGHIVNVTSFGQTSWLGIHSSGRLPLGLVSPGASTGGLHTQCSCGGSGGESGGGESGGSGGDGDHHGDGDSSGEPDDDFKCHEDDGDGDRSCSSSSSGTDDVDLHADNEPGDACDSSDVDTDAEKPEHKRHHACGGGDDDSSGGGERTADGGGGSGGSGGGGDTATDGGGSGGGCYCTSQCAPGDTCVAKKCVPPTPSPTPAAVNP